MRFLAATDSPAAADRFLGFGGVGMIVFLICSFLFSLSVAPPASAQASEASLGVAALRAEQTTAPLGIEARRPGLSWQLRSQARGARQTAYRVIVASTLEKVVRRHGDVWDSGQVASEQSVHVRYAGPLLRSRQRYWWAVRVWDTEGHASSWSEAAWWEMGLLEQSDWEAHWVSARPPADSMPPPRPAPLFRKVFDTESASRTPIEHARLYISGLGYYEAYLNGRKIGARVLDPAVTQYDHRVKYATYDVTEQFAQGKNALGVVLGNGWYNMHTASAWDFDEAPWRAAPALLAQLEITYRDGTRQVVATDASWSVHTDGPTVFNGIRNGETYDARREQAGWVRPGYEQKAAWTPAHEVEGPAGRLSAQAMPPIRVQEQRGPVQVTEPAPDTLVYDFGQNLSGWADLRARGPRGTEVTIRYGERLYDDGTLDQEEISRFVFSGETQTDHYILKGEGTERWHPRFVYHGFRYAEVTTSSPEVVLDSVIASVVHTDFEAAGRFESSSDVLNAIHEAMRWSYRTNFHSYPTDCPHREKIGWSGDAHLAAEAGLYNFRAARGYRKWIDDFADAQRPDGRVPGIVPTSGWGYTWARSPWDPERGYGPQWEGAFLLVPWDVYRFTGDESILERYYDDWTSYVGYLKRHADEYTLRFGIDDHKPAFTETEAPILATGHFYACARLLARAARVLERPEDAQRYAALSDSIRVAFNDAFLHAGTMNYGNGGQTSLAEALYYGMAPPGKEALVLENLLNEIERRDGHIDAGVVGTKYVLKALTAHGQTGTAYEMVTKKTYPGWGHWMAKGATTLWQNWDGSQSHNHVMFGSVGAWIYEALAGLRIDPERPGFKRILIKPAVVEELAWVEAEHASPYGPVAVSWRKEGDDRLCLEVEVPPNTTARIHVPTTNAASVTEGGVRARQAEGIRFMRADNRYAVYEVGAGTYRFAAVLDS